MKRKAHVRKTRRLANARLRTGKKIVRHKSLSGRTGTAHSKKRKSWRKAT
jgi:hypothetical protein